MFTSIQLRDLLFLWPHFYGQGVIRSSGGCRVRQRIGGDFRVRSPPDYVERVFEASERPGNSAHSQLSGESDQSRNQFSSEFPRERGVRRGCWLWGVGDELAPVDQVSRRSSLSGTGGNAMFRGHDVLQYHAGPEHVALSEESVLAPVCGVEAKSDLQVVREVEAG